MKTRYHLDLNSGLSQSKLSCRSGESACKGGRGLVVMVMVVVGVVTAVARL